jgi:hypothetical protein
METGQLESVPEIIECFVYHSGSWPNISGAKLTGTGDSMLTFKKYSYTFNNLWNKKVTFGLELIGREFEYLYSFEIKTTTKK